MHETDKNISLTRHLIEDGRRHLVLPQGLDLACPLRILHGDRDADVPWQHGHKTFAAIRSPDAQFTLIKDGDHRLSRGQDILAIHRAAEGLAADYLASVASNAVSPSR